MDSSHGRRGLRYAGGCIHHEQAGAYTFLEQAAEGAHVCHAISSAADSCTVQSKQLALQ